MVFYSTGGWHNSGVDDNDHHNAKEEKCTFVVGNVRHRCGSEKGPKTEVC